MNIKAPIIVTHPRQFGDAIRLAEKEKRQVIIETGWRTWWLRFMLRLMYKAGMFANNPDSQRKADQ